MPARIANIILLVEDRTTGLMVRRYLERLGQHKGNVRVRLPDGRGSGEQFVRERYASEVRAMRTAHTNACLIVAIDADTGPTADRRRNWKERFEMQPSRRETHASPS